MGKNGHIILTNEELLALQNKGAEIFAHVISAIEKMGLTYYCVGGTAIGAKKYHGFIPWDDDIDIAMPRDDYMKFLMEGSKYLPEHLFISSCFTEKKYFGSVAKVRDINTSYFDVETARFDICHGAFIDVFPIDGYVPLTKKEKFWHKVLLGKIEFTQRKKKPFATKFKGFVCYLICLFKSLNRCCLDDEKLLMKHKVEDCDQVYNRIMVFKKEIFGKPTKGTFMGLEVNLPEKVDDYLFQCYGNIDKVIPQEKQIPHHFAYLIDLNTPYTKYKYKHGRIVKKS